MAMARTSRPRPSDSTYLELVRSLFGTLVPSAIMSALFIATALAAIDTTPDPWLVAIASLGCVAAVARLIIFYSLRRRVLRDGLDLDSAYRTEIVFGVAHLVFAGLLGLFAATCFIICQPQHHSVIVALVVGYAAGVAAGFSLRPWIGISAILLSVVPPILSSLYLADNAHLLLALILTALMAGGLGSMLGRYRNAVETTEIRQMFASLARRDRLTGLANRLGLEDRFAEVAAAGEDSGVILHCLDLDRFKPVNDSHGHAVGDLLLKAVASRLERLIRPQDLAVRLGGDEFAVLQTGVRHADEGDLLARRIDRAIAAPYTVESHELTIGTSIGSAGSAEHGMELAALLEAADRDLYGMKADRHGGRALAG